MELIESSGLFLTSRQRQLITGGFRIRDRRRKPDEPFNPFAANANQVRQKKRSERSAANATTQPNQTRTDQRQSTDSSDFRKKQEEARQRLGGQAASHAIVQKPAVDSKNLNQPAESAPTQQVSRADRLAELRKQSQASVKKTESILDPSPQQAVVAEPVDNNPPIVESTTVVQSVESVNIVESAPSESASSKNVFKQIVTTAPKKREHRRRRSRHDDTGGGRQPKVKKLNRQRYNDYKYAARDILEDESIADEHRSNLLGQIWAKGERIGVSATLEFIDEKEEQLIINNEVAKKLRDLVKALTTRR
ncbi:MAG: hypothetical protein CMA16_05505 [Euryarchaeota archaeon]|nr:hypothetical protein [Euryarchaeota archaeon]